jgi:hypothetical protein
VVVSACSAVALSARADVVAGCTEECVVDGQQPLDRDVGPELAALYPCLDIRRACA